MTTIYVAWHSIFDNVPVPWNGYNKHSYLVRDLDSNTANTTDQEIIRGGVQNLTFEQAALNLINGGTVTGALTVEAGASSTVSADGLNNTGDADGDGFLNNDKDRNGVADTVTDRHYTAVNLAPAFAYLGTSNADVVWAAMESYAQDLEDSDFSYRFLSWNCQATMVSVLASVGIDFFNNVPTGSVATDYVSRNVLLSGDGGFNLFGFGGDDKIYDTGGNDTFHGGDGTTTTATNYLDGVDRIHYVGEGDVTYRYVVLGGGQSAWNAVQTNGSTVSTDTLYSIEQFRGASFPNSNNVIDFSDYTSGLTIDDAPKSSVPSYKDDASDLISSLMTTQLGAGNTVALIDMNHFIGTDFNDTFNLLEYIGRRFDGGGGDDTLSYNFSNPQTISDANAFVGGKAMYVANSFQPHHEGHEVAIDVENFNVATSTGYFIVEAMGNDFTFLSSTSNTNSTYPQPLYTTISYANYASPITFNLGSATDGVNTDTFNNLPAIIGSNNGDTYNSFSGTLGFNAIPAFTGSGNDVFNTSSHGPVYYGGGHDVNYSGTDRYVLPLGTDLADIDIDVINTRLVSSNEFSRSYKSDIKVTLSDGGSITYEGVIGYTYNINTDTYSANGSVNPLLVGFFSPIGITYAGITPSPTWDKTTPPSYVMYTKNESLNSMEFRNAYHGGMGSDSIDLGVFTASNTFYGYEGDDTIQGDQDDNSLFGGGGDDVISGGAGSDLLEGGEGMNELHGGSGHDTYRLVANSTNIIDDNTGMNHLVLSVTDQVIASLNGDFLELSTSTGQFYASIADYRSFVSIKFGDGSSTSMTQSLKLPASAPSPTLLDDAIDARYYSSALNISLLAGNDVFIGTDKGDIVFGNDGNDNIDGYNGDDFIEGGAGNDVLNGSVGIDTVSYASATSGVTLSLAVGAVVQNTGGAGSDSVTQFENILGSSFNDTLTGNSSANVIDGGAGNDTINGGSGTDTVTYSRATAGVTVSLATTAAQNTGGAGTDTVSNFENLTGSAFNDTLTGSTANNIIEGGAGNDSMNGGSGTDTVTYSSASAGVTVSLALTTAQNTLGAGSDTITAFENLTGSAFNDVLTGDANANVLDGGDGNDIIQGGAGNDNLVGGLGVDTLTYASAAAAVTVSLNTTSAQNTGGAGTDTVSTFENLTGSAFNDTLTGNSSNNVIEGGAGNDTMNAMGGIDTLNYKNATAGVTINLATTIAQNTGGAGTDTISGFENVTGSNFNDVLTGDGNANTMEGGAGNDTINGASGTDTLTYASATAGVTVNLATTTAQNTGGAGTDTISNFENLTGSGFNDTLTGTSSSNVIEGGAGNDTMNGGSGTDTLTYASAAAGISVSLAVTTAQNTGGAGTDTVSNFEYLTGSAFNDILIGNSGSNTINGGYGDDLIEGGAGDDALHGGSGGIDTASYASATAGVTVNLASTVGQNTGGAGTDTLSFFENLKGSAFNDTLVGDGNSNVIEGGVGNDILSGQGGIDTVTYAGATSGVTANLSTVGAQNTGGAGTDTLSGFENLTGSGFNDTLTGDSNANNVNGGAGNDAINGGGGNDFLYGGAGQDTMTGSTGRDVFIFENASAFSNVDTITDFNAGAGDKIDLHDLIDVAFDPVQHAITQFVDIRNSGGNSIVAIDRDGAGTTYGFVDVVTLTGLTNQDEATLFNNGTLLAA